jgi:hypothetical protein
MEYVKVIFPTDRFVYIDGDKNGNTNEVLRADAGTHVFDLGPLANYQPASRKVLVKNTSEIEPLEIEFYPKKPSRKED